MIRAVNVTMKYGTLPAAFVLPQVAELPMPVPVPPAYTQQPDGFRVQKGGVIYTKKAGMLVPQGP